MTTLWRTDQASGLLQLADVLDLLLQGQPPFRFTAYDGSATGPEDAPFAPAPALAARRGLPRHLAGVARDGPRVRQRRPRDHGGAPRATPTRCCGSC